MESQGLENLKSDVEWQKRKTIEVELEAKILDRQHELNLKKMDIAGEWAKQGVQVEADWDRQEVVYGTLQGSVFILTLLGGGYDFSHYRIL